MTITANTARSVDLLFIFTGSLKFSVFLGGGSGIGRAVCQAFVKEGAKVAAVDINQQQVTGTLQSLPGKTTSHRIHQSMRCKLKGVGVSDFPSHLSFWTGTFQICPFLTGGFIHLMLVV